MPDDSVDEVGVRLSVLDRPKFSAEMAAAEASMDAFSKTSNISVGRLQQLGKELDKDPFTNFKKTAKSAFEEINGSVGGLTSAIQSIYSPITSLLGSGVVQTGLFRIAEGFTAAAGAATYFGLSMYSSMQQSTIAFSHMLGSKAAGDQFTKQLVDMANKTPFTFKNIAGPAQRLLNTGDTTTKALSDLTAIGDAAAGADPMEGQAGIDRIGLAISQIKQNPGALKMQDINQLVQANLDPFGLIASVTGKSKSQIVADQEQHKLPSAQTADILMMGFEKRYGGLMAEQNKTLSGQWSNFVGAAQVDMAKATTPLAEMLQRDMPSIQRFMETKLVPLFERLEKTSMRWGQQLGTAFVHGGADGFVAKLGEMTGRSDQVEKIWKEIKKDTSDGYDIFVHEYLPTVKLLSRALFDFAETLMPVFHFMADHPRLFTDLFEVFIGGLLIGKISGIFAAIVMGIGDVILHLTEGIAKENEFRALAAAPIPPPGGGGGGEPEGGAPVGGGKPQGRLRRGFGKIGGYAEDLFTDGHAAGPAVVSSYLQSSKQKKKDQDLLNRLGAGKPGMASGGTVTAAGLSWVGEHGPELLSLPQGAQVQPLPPAGLQRPGTTVIFQAGAVVIPAADYLKGKELADIVVSEISGRIARS